MSYKSEIDDVAVDKAVRQVQEGKTAPFEVVVRRYERPLRAWLAVQAPPGIDVEEIAQRAFVTAYGRISDYSVGTDFGAWLFTIARYQLKTETTRLRRIADYHARYELNLLELEQEKRLDEPPEHQVMRLDHLKTCMESLGEHVRRFVTWRYDECIPLDVMAERSGRSVAAVKKQLWKVRRKLHDCIESKMTAQGSLS
ncbi:MAG: sigma-70 family RNA polymerase sigma factor [Kiritimatiellia bacterium]|jgi:RNA polymerase sigma-70 factor (ECF subfamily)|nr:sigma-70 family RNA polymerase sigma factor [Kiritimatiellia bacterium]MDP6847830.1 sigma-70 family RNA polymerase sigma factor [Kiritimatiellia bacterium]